MAEAIGVTEQAISRWEKGGAYPDMKLIPSIANCMKHLIRLKMQRSLHKIMIILTI